MKKKRPNSIVLTSFRHTYRVQLRLENLISRITCRLLQIQPFSWTLRKPGSPSEGI